MLSFDGVFVAIHGTPGEDGKIQGYFDLLGIPYTSCDQATSALTFDKFFCNNFVSSFGVNISRSIVLKKGEAINEDELLKRISLPLFVKPNRGGSSVGTSKVKTREELLPALKLAFHEDSLVMLEEHIPGRELSCGTITYKGKIRTLPLTEIISKKEFFDYEAKYQGMSEEITPAEVPIEVADSIKETSVRLYKLLNCMGIVRFDYILNGTELYFLEVNTVPGFSELSIVPQQALKAGISLQDLFSEAMMNALNDR
jgi:D-alanine-D-alanine ligase